MAEKQVTVLEGIITDLGNELYQKWYNAATEDQKTEEMSKALRENATQTTFWVIQEFMNRFNAAAEALKDK
jgi:mevalonate pyrophosphate decarboxylase